jgi:hypothetical protein
MNISAAQVGQAVGVNPTTANTAQKNDLGNIAGDLNSGNTSKLQPDVIQLSKDGPLGSQGATSNNGSSGSNSSPDVGDGTPQSAGSGTQSSGGASDDTIKALIAALMQLLQNPQQGQSQGQGGQQSGQSTAQNPVSGKSS